MVKGINLTEGSFVIYNNQVFEVIMNEFFGELVLDCPTGQDIINGEESYELCSEEDYILAYENHGY